MSGRPGAELDLTRASRADRGVDARLAGPPEWTMIPTMILFGLVLGRWWKSTLVAAAIVWPLLASPALLQAGAGIGGFAAAALLGVANAAVGVAVHQSVLALVRRATARQRRTTSP